MDNTTHQETSASERAIAILEANSRVPYGLFGVIEERGRFPPLRFLNAFLLAGADPGDPVRRGASWPPFALDAADYAEVERWWHETRPGAVTDDLGASGFSQWQDALLDGDWDSGPAGSSIDRADPAPADDADDADDLAGLAADAPVPGDDDAAEADASDDGGDADAVAAAAAAEIDIDVDAFAQIARAAPVVVATDTVAPAKAQVIEGALDQPCPCCGARTIAPWRKFRMFADVGGRCRACHRIWKVSRLAPLGAAAVLALAAVGYMFVHHTPRLVGVLAAGTAFAIVAVFVLVPVIRR